MRKENEFGTIQSGLRADLLLIESDPRADVAALSKIRGVSVRGIWLDHAALENICERVRTIFADDQGLSDADVPSLKKTDQLLATMTQLQREGAIQMDHNLRELKELLVKMNRSIEPVDALLSANKGR